MSQNNIENDIGYHNLSFEELSHEISHSDNYLAKCFVEKLLEEMGQSGRDKHDIEHKIRRNY